MSGLARNITIIWNKVSRKYHCQSLNLHLKTLRIKWQPLLSDIEGKWYVDKMNEPLPLLKTPCLSKKKKQE